MTLESTLAPFQSSTKHSALPRFSAYGFGKTAETRKFVLFICVWYDGVHISYVQPPQQNLVSTFSCDVTKLDYCFMTRLPNFLMLDGHVIADFYCAKWKIPWPGVTPTQRHVQRKYTLNIIIKTRQHAVIVPLRFTILAQATFLQIASVNCQLYVRHPNYLRPPRSTVPLHRVLTTSTIRSYPLPAPLYLRPKQMHQEETASAKNQWKSLPTIENQGHLNPFSQARGRSKSWFPSEEVFREKKNESEIHSLACRKIVKP